jgi:hypothetical protein
MTTEYKFDVTLQPYAPKAGQLPAELGIVGIDTAARYGYWEYRDGSEGGGLWFEPAGRTLELIDYDGAFELPRAVVAALRAAGYILDETFDA